MSSKRETRQADANKQSFSIDLIHQLQWDDLRIFLKVIQAGSFRKTANEFGLSINTIRGRIERLEDVLQTKVMVRDFDGIQLTAPGLQLQRIAEGMIEGAARSIGLETNRLVRPGQITIGAPKALGAGWLPPLIPRLEPKLGGIEINLVCHHDLTIEHSPDIDVGLSWGMPSDGKMIASRIASIHLIPYASQGYVRRFGMPTHPDELLNHRYIEQVGPDLKPSLINNVVESIKPTTLKTNSSAALLCAVASGQGIAFLPTYSSAIFSELQPVDMGIRFKRDLFCYFHAEAKSSNAIQATVKWLKDCFNPDRFPWFASEFVDPATFGDQRFVGAYRRWGPIPSATDQNSAERRA